MRDQVVRYVKDAEFGVAMETRDFRKSVMGNVEFFEVR